KTLRLTAWSTASRVALTHRPRPGSLRRTSATTSPFGPTTKRMSSSTGLTSRDSAQVRSDPGAEAPRSSSVSRSLSCATASIKKPFSLRLYRSVFALGRFFGRRVQLGLGDPAGLHTGLHDQRLGLLAGDVETVEEAWLALGFAVLALGPAGQVVGGAAGEILDRLHAALTELDQDRGGDAGNVLHVVLDAEFLALGVELRLLLREVFARALLQLARRVLVEAFDRGDFLFVDEREFLDRAETFRGKQLADHFVEIEGVDKDLRAVLELGLAALGLFLLGEDVYVPAGELRGETHVLAAAADGQRQLLVRHHDLDALAILVEHDLGDFRRRQRVHHEGGDVRRPRDDVDLLALQFVHHGLHARAAHADAGADGVDAGIARDHGDFGARARIAGHRLHLDDAVIDFRNFLREQLGGELRMRAREEDLRAARLAAHVVDIGADAVAVAEHFARQQLVATHDGLAAAEVDDDVAVFDALDDAVDDVADAILV